MGKFIMKKSWLNQDLCPLQKIDIGLLPFLFKWYLKSLKMFLKNLSQNTTYSNFLKKIW